MANYNGKSIPTDGSKDIITWSEEQKNDIQSALNGVTKADVGLGRVINEKQAWLHHIDVLNTTSTITLANESAQYLLVGSWSGTSSTFMYVINTRQGGINIGEIKGDSQVTVTASGLTLTVSRSVYRFVSLVRIW